MILRQGKTKSTLQASIDSALLAVEVYNKPRTTFRSEAFISLMVMAWVRLLHAYFNREGVKYYEKNKQGRFIRIDDEGRIVKSGGEFKTWGLRECLANFEGLSSSVKENLKFFIGLRNKIEHRHIDKREVDTLIFGECQSLLYNYENLLIILFGAEYAINESLVYSLQFSKLRTSTQQIANKSALSKDMKDIVTYIKNYRTGLTEEVFSSQEYSVKLILIPKVANTNRAEEAIDFIRWSDLDEQEKETYEKLIGLIKDKRIPLEAANVKRLKTGNVIKKVNENLPNQKITSNLHVVLYKLFSVRPPNGADDPFDTIAEFCLYDETHNDYVYLEAWVVFLVHFLQSDRFSYDELRDMEKNKRKLNIEEYRIS